MQSAVLLITFNRPVHTRCVLEAILRARPPRLYVFQDAPREGNEADEEKCAAVRAVVNTLVNTLVNARRETSLEALEKPVAVQMHPYYASRNLGCGAGPATAISWFFAQEEEGIVMEDDCLPHPDFFPYCETLLARYRGDERVQFINSTLYPGPQAHWRPRASYGFSRYMVSGAWAAWRRSWEGFDPDLQSARKRPFRRQLRRLLGVGAEADWWYFKLWEIQKDKGEKTYWDYQMQILLFRKAALTLHPKCNLVTNIGFDAEGTHTRTNADGRGGRPAYPLLPLEHPQRVFVDQRMDALCFAKARPRPPFQAFKNYVYQSLRLSDALPATLLKFYKQLKHRMIKPLYKNT